jgi:CheY-like chemotaxis protein
MTYRYSDGQDRTTWSPGPETSRRSLVSPSARRLRVLILEAGGIDRPFYTILAANVRRWGYEAFVLSTEGMQAAGGRREVEGDILLYDMDAPLQPMVVWGDAGPQAASLSDVQQMISQKTWPKVRLVIALSSRSVSRHSLEKVGAIALLHKPFDMRYLERYLRVFQKLLCAEMAEMEVQECTWQRSERQSRGALLTSRILVADDRRDVTGTIRQCLVEQGRERYHYEVREVHDGLELLEQCLIWQPDCVVTDVLMPWLNGYQVMRCLADCTVQPMPAFVVISALMQHEIPVNRSYVREPVVLYVEKPFDVDNVLAVIEQALAR